MLCHFLRFSIEAGATKGTLNKTRTPHLKPREEDVQKVVAQLVALLVCEQDVSDDAAWLEVFIGLRDFFL